MEEAALLAGTTWLLEGKNAEAAEHFGRVKSALGVVNRVRASVLQLYALLEEGDNDGGLAFVVEEFPRMNQMLQIATFQTLALQLGSQFLEAEEWRKAIQCLQRVWDRDRLIGYQEDRLADLEDGLAAAEAQPTGDPYRKFQLKQMIAKVERELENFGKIADFDAALRLRLATAFQAMRRYREAALIMEEMLRDMPPSPVVESATTQSDSELVGDRAVGQGGAGGGDIRGEISGLGQDADGALPEGNCVAAAEPAGGGDCGLWDDSGEVSGVGVCAAGDVYDGVQSVAGRDERGGRGDV